MSKLLDLIKKELGSKKNSSKAGLLGGIGKKIQVPGKKKVKKGPEKQTRPTPIGTIEPLGVNVSIIARNSMVFPGISRSINTIRQNIVLQAKLLGLKPSLGTDAKFLKAGERNIKLGVERQQEQNKRPVPPQKITKKTKKPNEKTNRSSTLSRKIFDPSILIFAIYGALNVAELFQGLWDDIITAWNKWIIDGKFWEIIKEKSSYLVDLIKNTFTIENLINFIKNPGDYLIPLWETMGGFFNNIANFIVDKLRGVLSFFGISIKQKEIFVPELPKQKEQKANPINIPEPEMPKMEEEKPQKTTYTKEQIAIAEEAEKKAQYTGQDEIVRERVGLKGPSAAEMWEKIIPQSISEKPKEPETIKQPLPEEMPPIRVTPVPNIGADDKSVMAMIKKHEGVRVRPYKDSLGFWTVGVGHLIGNGKTLPPEWNREFTMQEIDALFVQDYEQHKKMAEKVPGYTLANEKGRAALIDLTFNLGGNWFKKFKNTVAALAAGDFQKAADELTGSLWYKQVKGRAQTIVSLIRDGLGKAIHPTPAPTIKTEVASSGPTPSPVTNSSTVPALTAIITKSNSGVSISRFNKPLDRFKRPSFNPINPEQSILVADSSGKISTTPLMQEVQYNKSLPGSIVAAVSTEISSEQRKQTASAIRPVIINNTVTVTGKQTNIQNKTTPKPIESWADRLVSRIT